MCMISIIVPVYKIEKYIRSCMDSLLAQTFKDIEIIAVDDGSPDISGEICEQYAAADSRVRVIHKQNGGLSSARNAGIEAAKGKYIMTVDGDDYIHPDMCSKLYNAIESSGCDMAVCSINNIAEDGQIIKELNDENPIKDEILTKTDFYEALLKRGNWYYVVAWNKLYKKDLFDGLNYPEGKIHEDEHLIHRLVDRCNSVCCISDRLYNYIKHDGSIMNSVYNVKRLDILSALFDRSWFYIETNVAHHIIRANLVGLIKTLYGSYRCADLKNEQFKIKYVQIHKQLKELLKHVTAYDIGMGHKMFFKANLISPRLCYMVFGRFMK